MLGKVNLDQQFGRFQDHWSPKIIATVNDYDVKIDEACRRAGQSLAIASQIQHGTSIRRIRTLRARLRKWEDAEAVKCLDEELLLLPQRKMDGVTYQ